MTPPSPLVDALVLVLEAVERILQSRDPALTLASSEVAEFSGEAHCFKVSGVGSGTLAVSMDTEAALGSEFDSLLDDLATAIGGDLGAALDRDVALVVESEGPREVEDVGVAVSGTFEGAEVPITVSVIVETELGIAIGELVRERLENLNEQPSEEQAVVDPIREPVEVLSADFPQMGASASQGPGGDMSLLSDVQLAVTVELGRTTMRVRDLLELGHGSVIELDRSVGTPVDMLVNGTVVARGDVVVVDDELGVRVTEVMNQGTGAVT